MLVWLLWPLQCSMLVVNWWPLLAKTERRSSERFSSFFLFFFSFSFCLPLPLLLQEIARGKAYGALGMGVSSRAVFENTQQRPSFWTSVFAASGGRVIASPGGVLIAGAKGKIIGAVGVSGDAADEDESAAIFAVSKAGLTPTPFSRSSKL